MGQIIVTKTDNTILKLGRTSPYSVVTKAEQKMTLMGDDVVDITVISEGGLKFSIGDSIEVFGRKYVLQNLPALERVTENRFEYNLQFKGAIHLMQNVLYKLDGDLGTAASSSFPLIANLERFVDLLIINLNAVYGTGTWQRGSMISTDDKNLTFSNETCFAVLSRFVELFSVEYKINHAAGVWTIDFDFKVGRDLPDVFSYGKGILNLKRNIVSDDSFVTKLYIFGSSNNLPSNYRNFSTRLKLPEDVKGDTEPPTAPQNLRVFKNPNGTARLEWSASTDNVGVDHYVVYRSDNGGDFYFYFQANSTYLDNIYNLTSSGVYRFKVKAMDEAGNISLSSSIVTLDMNSAANPPYLTNISEHEDGGVLLVWQNPLTGYDYIEIYRKSGVSSYVSVGRVDPPGISFIDIAAIPGRSYFYKARTFKQGLYSDFSNILNITL